MASRPVRSGQGRAWTIAVALAGLATSGAQAQGIAYAKIELSAKKIAPNLYTFTGSPGDDPVHPDAAGGRITALVGPEGVLMVDAQYAPITDKVVVAIRKTSDKPIRYLINTHAHLDHTGGNAAISALGALVIAREESREEMLAPLPAIAGNAAPPRVPARLPVLTFGMGGPMKIRLDGETVDLIPVPPAHTAGDAIIKFETADVLAVGDVYRNYGYPFISLADGGTLKGMVAALDVVMNTADPDTLIVPGHGGLVHRADVVVYRDMIVAVATAVQRMIGQGRSQREILQARPTAPYDGRTPGGQDPVVLGGPTSADRFVSEIYSELTKVKS
ncbi:MBL fold metallo-hydrolase [Caulobacter sp. S45]|uniref:MBL fold metallo-hydrolase n=1 Tax=Caulobacter sp. S45 TaxID=1641861 RepID=UPI0020B12E71|nr:MBL fold metallo-hydrolase [Caulobacter sp. S45]